MQSKDPSIATGRVFSKASYNTERHITIKEEVESLGIDTSKLRKPERSLAKASIKLTAKDFLYDIDGEKFACKRNLMREEDAEPVFSHIISAVYNLSDPEDLTKYNAILQNTNVSSPTIAIENKRIEFHEGSYVILLEYRNVCYKIRKIKK